jgi:hypothetical protein
MMQFLAVSVVLLAAGLFGAAVLLRKKLRPRIPTLAAFGCLMLAMVSSPDARADSTTIDFDLGVSGDPSAPSGVLGTMTLTLNGDGSITANVSANGPLITDVGFNGPSGTTVSGPAGSSQLSLLGTAYGDFADGIQLSTYLETFTFTVTDSVPYGSVFQLANFAGTGSPNTEFLMETSTPSAFGGGDASSTPEPSSMVLLGTGLLGIVLVMRKRLFA